MAVARQVVARQAVPRMVAVAPKRRAAEQVAVPIHQQQVAPDVAIVVQRGGATRHAAQVELHHHQ